MKPLTYTLGAACLLLLGLAWWQYHQNNELSALADRQAAQLETYVKTHGPLP